MTWDRHAACTGTDPDIWFPDRDAMPVAALRICQTCPVQQPCLDEALSMSGVEDAGVWGFTTVQARHEIRAGDIDVAEAHRRAARIAAMSTAAERLVELEPWLAGMDVIPIGKAV